MFAPLSASLFALLFAPLSVPLFALPFAPLSAPPLALGVTAPAPAPGASPSAHVDAVVRIADLRAYAAGLGRSRARQSETKAGQAYFASPAGRQRAAAQKQLDDLAQLAAPDGSPSAATLILFRIGEASSWQIMIDVKPGIGERLAHENDGGGSTDGFALYTDASGLRVRLAEGRLLYGRVDGTRLRFAPDAASLAAALEVPQPHGALRSLGTDCAAYAFIDGASELAARLRGALGNAQAALMLASARALAACLSGGAPESWRLRLLFDAPTIAQLGPMLRRPGLDDAMLSLWGPPVSSFVSLALPRPLVQGGLEYVQQALVRQGQPAMPAALLQALAHSDGRISVAGFGSPGDWAAGLGFTTAADAQAAMPGLEAWLGELLRPITPYAKSTITRLPLAGSAAQALSVQASGVVARPHVLPVGERLLIVGQRRRAELLLAAASAAKMEPRDESATSAPPATASLPSPPPDSAANDTDATPSASTLAGPLTPLVREVVARPALATGYTVHSGDGTWGLWAALLGSLLAPDAPPVSPVAALGAAAERPLQLDELAPLVTSGAADWVAGAALDSLLLYDVGFSVDLRDSLLVVDLVGSWI